MTGERRIAELEAFLTEILAETTRWQRDAQTPEERAWANVHHASISRVLARSAVSQPGTDTP